jgi:hypothetical protein
MERITRDWIRTSIGILLMLLAINAFFGLIMEGEILSSIGQLILISVGWYYAKNSFTVINKDKDLLSLPTLFGWTRTDIRLSEIESYTTERNHNYSWALTVYGPFGQNTATYSTMQEVINHLENAIS